MSDTKKSGENLEKITFVYLIITVFCAIFGGVYEWFSHGVFSYYMLYAFLIPLMGGVVPFFFRIYFRCGRHDRFSLYLHHFGISALTVGCLFRGVLEIYGTTNRLTILYFIFGESFLLLGSFTYFIKKKLRA